MAAVASRVARPAPRVTMLVATGLAVIAVAGSQFGIAEAAGAFGRVASAGAGLNERWAQLHSDANSVIPGRDRSVTEIMALVTLLAGLALTLAFTPRVRRWALPALCVLALLGSILQTRWLFPRVIEGIAQSYPSILAGVEQQPRDWIDRAAPDGATVGLQPGRLSFVNDGDFWMWTEFWNKEADREYTLTGISPFTGWPGHRLAVDPATGRVTTPELPDLLVVSPTDPTLRLAGEVVERSAYGVALMKPAKPLQALWRLEDATYDGAPKGPGRTSRLRIFAPSGAVAVTFKADVAEEGARGVPFPFVVEDDAGTRRVELEEGKQRTVRVRGREATLRMPEVKLPKKRSATVRVVAIDEAG
jgi:hypothetical protein